MRQIASGPATWGDWGRTARVHGGDPTLAWYAYASRVDQVTGDAVYRAARGRQSDLP